MPMPPLKFMGGSSRDELDTRELKLPPAFPLWHMQSGKGGGGRVQGTRTPPHIPTVAQAVRQGGGGQGSGFRPLGFKV